MAAPGTTRSHETKSSVIRLLLAQPGDVGRHIRSSYLGNDVFIINLHKISNNKFNLTISSRNGKIDTV